MKSRVVKTRTKKLPHNPKLALSKMSFALLGTSVELLKAYTHALKESNDSEKTFQIKKKISEVLQLIKELNEGSSL